MKKSKIVFTLLFVLSQAILGSQVFSQRYISKVIYADSLEKITNDIRNDKYGKISSLLIYHGHRIAYESYFGFTQASTLHPISSVTKSVTSLAVGICMDKGLIPSLDVKISDYFPAYKHIFDNDSLKQSITLKHLLEQTSGLKWDEWTIHYSYAGNPLIELSQNPENWIPIILQLPMDTIPGTKFNYNSACSDLIKKIVEKSSGQDFKMFVEENLLNPLGINKYHWDTYPNNGEPAWGGLSLTTRDMAKIGILVQEQGKWGSKRIISKEWINKSITQTIPADSIGYGYHWWIKPQYDSNPLVFAAGYGDQYVFIAPDKQLVVAINAKNFTDHKWKSDHNELIDRIIKSINLKIIAQESKLENRKTL